VLTDELVQLAGDDRELVGVLAHELGHIEQRHALRSVLQKSALSLAVSLFTGDVSSSFAAALPSFLLEARYSREFEREADAFAVEKLRAAGIDPAHLARMLERLRAHAGEPDHPLIGYLQTHPPTPERIDAIRRAGR
jgi:predicted Zn-dependent protease